MTESAVLVVFQGFAFAVGAALGSFANVAIDRLPADRSLIPGSRCDACGAPIRPTDNIPILSWILLRGRCRDCGVPIGVHVPLIELLVALLALLQFRRMIPEAQYIDAGHLVAWGVFLFFLLLLTIASYTDIRHRIIPDETSIYAVPLGIGGHALLNALGYEGWLSLDWRASVFGALFTGGFFMVAALFARAARGADALGWGDVKLVAMIGAFLGPLPGGMLVMMMGSVIGAMVGILATIVLRARPWLPFGPALAVAAAVYVISGDTVVEYFFPGMMVFFGGRVGP